MKSKSKSTLFLTQTGLIAAAYIAATYLSASANLAYGPVQFRLSEALCILPVFTPAAIPGLAVGCVIANIASPLGYIDIIFGALATLLAAVFSRMLRKINFRGLPLLSLMPPVVFNAFIVSAYLIVLDPGIGRTLAGYFGTVLYIALGETGVLLLLGLPLLTLLKKTRVFDRINSFSR